MDPSDCWLHPALNLFEANCALLPLSPAKNMGPPPEIRGPAGTAKYAATPKAIELEVSHGLPGGCRWFESRRSSGCGFEVMAATDRAAHADRSQDRASLPHARIDGGAEEPR
jgi:hypothetical protein